MTQGGKVNFLIVDDYTGKTYQWLLTRRAIKIVLFAASLVVVLALAAIVLAFIVFGYQNRLEAISSENLRLTVYAMELDQLRDELNYHRAFTRRICNLVGIEYPDSMFMTPVDTLGAKEASALATVSDSAVPPLERSLMEYAAAPLPSELNPHPRNHPLGIPLRGRPSRGFAPDEENIALRHFGLDIAGKEGSPVFATAAGLVKMADWDDALGYMIIIDHENGFSTIYGHNNAMMVEENDRVKFGEVVALSGNSGISSAPHLHYEIRYQEQPVDPVDYLFPDSLLTADGSPLP